MSAAQMTGLVYDAHRFEYAVDTGNRRKDSGGEDLVPSVPPVDDPEHPAPLPEITALLEEHHRRLRGELHVAIPADRTLLHVTDFPTGEPEELAGMVELRAEDLTPFPMDRTYVGWELLHRGETASRVLIALAGHAVIDPIHEQLQAHRLLAHRVDVDVLAWWHLVSGDFREHQGLVMIVDGAQTHLIVVEDGTPIAFLSLGDARETPADILLEDLQISLSGVEADRGSVPAESLTLYVRADDAVADTLQPLLDGFSGTTVTRDLNQLPALSQGVLRRTRESKMDSLLDLSPPSWKEEEALRAMRKRMLGWGAGIAGAWILAAGMLAGYVTMRDRALQNLRREILQQQDPVSRVQELSAQVRSLSQFTDRSTSALEILRIMAEAAPGDGRVLIRDFQYRKDQGVNISGEATGDFFLFQETLSESDLLRVTDFDTKQERNLTEFRLLTRWRWQDEMEGPP